MADPVPAAPAPADVKPGIKTTELYLAVLGLGALIWCLKDLVAMLPAIAATPGIPGWAVPLLGIAPAGVSWVIAKLVGEYGQLRAQLKLGASAGPVVDTPQDAVAELNKGT
jgi:hypothetical protein